MEYSDQGFEEFQDLLRPFRESRPLLWRIRDSLYLAMYYRAPGGGQERRHRAKLWSWSAWGISKALFPVKRAVPGAASDSRFHFLFCGMHSAHFDTLVPVVREIASLSGTAPVCAWSVDLMPEQQVLLASLGHVQVICLPELPSCSPAPTTLRAVARAVREVFVLERILQRTAHQDRIASRRSFVGEVVFYYLLALDFWERTLPLDAAGAAFTTSESPAFSKGFFAAARKRNWRAVHFCHGFRHASHQVSAATDLCAYSGLDRAWFQSRVEKGCTVRAIGNPRLEAIREAAGPPRGRKPGEPFRLLFFSTGEESPYTAEMVKADMTLLAAASETRAKYRLRIRPHPRERRDVLLNVANAIGFTEAEFSTGTLAEDVAWCDAAATAWSTALLEAAAAGRPCYWTDAGGNGFGGTDELQRAGIGRLIQSAEQWKQAVEEMFAGQAGPPALVPPDQLQALGICLPKTVSWRQRLEMTGG